MTDGGCYPPAMARTVGSRESNRSRSAISATRLQVAKLIDRLAPRILAFTRRLIAIPTENPPGRLYAECAARIVRELDRLGLEPRQIRAARAFKNEPAPSIVMGGVGSGRRTLCFHGHYDV